MYRSLKNQLTVKSTSIICISFFLIVALLIPKEDNAAPLPALLALAPEQYPPIPSDKVAGLHQLTQALSQQLTQPMVHQLVPQLAAAPAGWFMPQNELFQEYSSEGHFEDLTRKEAGKEAGEVVEEKAGANSGGEVEENTRVTITALDEATARVRILAWLKTNWQVYALDDADLLPAIQSLCPPVNEYNLLSHQQAMKPCLKHSLATGLRELAQKQQSLFQHPGRQVRIGVPAIEHQPPLGHAYTCFKGDLANSKVVLFAQSLGQSVNESITVQVIGAYPCADGKKYPDIQLNEQQGKTLFKRQARAIENAVALTF